jgi:conserved oligomeric Golgi complex subunit 2
VSGELQSLVNDEYAAFLSLGAALRGADEKVEEVSVGVIGFEKGVRGVRDNVAERRREVQRLVGAREAIGREIQQGREMLACAERVEDLERELAVVEGAEWEEDEDSDEDGRDGEAPVGSSERIGRLRRLVHGYVSLRNEISRLGGTEQPLMAKLLERLEGIRKTLLIDLSTALKQAKASGSLGSGRLVKIMGLYTLLDENAEAVKILKESKRN